MQYKVQQFALEATDIHMCGTQNEGRVASVNRFNVHIPSGRDDGAGKMRTNQLLHSINGSGEGEGGPD